VLCGEDKNKKELAQATHKLFFFRTLLHAYKLCASSALPSLCTTHALLLHSFACTHILRHVSLKLWASFMWLAHKMFCMRSCTTPHAHQLIFLLPTSTALSPAYINCFVSCLYDHQLCFVSCLHQLLCLLPTSTVLSPAYMIINCFVSCLYDHQLCFVSCLHQLCFVSCLYDLPGLPTQ
jgi:hypothetical protein